MVPQGLASPFPCLDAVVRTSQLIAGDAIAWSGFHEEDPLPARFAGLPPPCCRAEAMAVEAVLASFLNRLGRLLHTNVQSARGGTPCRFDPHHCVRADLPSANPASIVGAWSHRFAEAFARTHCSLAIRAAKRLDEHLETSIKLPDLADELCCTVSTLRRQVETVYRQTPAARRARKRGIAAIRLLRTTDWKVDAIAQEVGWKNRKGLYKAVHGLAGKLPSEIKALPDDAACALLARLGDEPAHASPPCDVCRILGVRPCEHSESEGSASN